MHERKKAGGPLAGIKVIELGTLIAGAFATRMLADFGAEVIKVEAPGAGDPLRTWRKLHNGTSLWWYLQSRNKKSITVNLKSADGQALVRSLVETADVLVENFRPGTLESWGLGWDDLSKINPKLVMVRVSGYGQDGPYSDRPGFGAIGEAMGGIRYTTGSPDRDPARTGVSLGDTLASLHAVIGALMCLLEIRSGDSKGQVVDVSLVESVLNVMESVVPEYDLFGHTRERSGSRLPGIAPTNAYRTRDDALIVIAGNGDSIFRRLMDSIGREDLRVDPRLQTNVGRVEHEAMIDDAISSWAVQFDVVDALAVLSENSIPAGKIYSAEDIVKDPHLNARGMITTQQLPDGVPVKFPGIIPKLSASPGQTKWLGPELGQDTIDVLTNCGLSPAQIEHLRSNNVI